MTGITLCDKMFFVNKQKLVEDFFETNIQIGKFLHQLSNISIEDKVTTMLQMHALTYLKKHPGETVGELAQSFQMSSSSIAQFIERLEKIKLISKISDENDRRITKLFLTKKGEKELEQIHKKMLEKASKLLDYISEEDLNQLVKIQTRMLKNLKNEKKI